MTEITTSGTLISTPNYPSEYKPNQDCKITIKFARRVRITFQDFDVSCCEDVVSQGANDCDIVQIFDGPDERSEQIGSDLCGPTNPPDVESTGSTMHLLFHTTDERYHYQGIGFQIEVLEIGNCETCFYETI